MELATIFPSKYIKAADLQGREPTVVIARAEIEKLGDDSKLVLYFQGKQKGLVTNRTNADRIAYLYGTNTDLWIGKEIVLFTELVSFQGKTTEAVRVRPPVKREPVAQPQAVTERAGYTLSTASGPRPSQRDGLEEVLDNSDAPF